MKNLITNIVILIVFTFSSTQVFSQKLEIKGAIQDDSTEEPISYATVILKDSNNKFLVGTTTNEEGFYTLEYEKGQYKIEYSFLGYKTLDILIELNKNIVKDIELNAEAVNIDEITVIGETTMVRQLIDKKIIEVGKDILSSGGTAATVLSQLSEVDADADGNISLRGNSNVQILINGKPSPLSSTELLVQISASEIKTIEIITSPSAKYRADGLTGIINIITKKKIKKGITSNNNISYNSQNAYSVSSNFNYGTNKVNYKIGGLYRRSKSKTERQNERIGIAPYQEESKHIYQGNLYRINASVDWFIDKKNEVSWNIKYSDNQHHTDKNKMITKTDVLTSEYNLSSHSHRNLQLGGNYRYTFKEKDFLEIDVDFRKNNNTLTGTFKPRTAIFDNIVENEIITSNIAVDHSYTLRNNLKLESGYLWYLKGLDNEKTIYDSLNIVNSKNVYTTKTSTHALYSQVNHETTTLGIQIGLRGEFYNRQATFIAENKKVNQTFLDLFPSVHFKYAPNEINTFSIGYNRRTYRPRLYQINPISSQSDAFTFREGNPDLEPEFSNNIDLTYLIKKDGISISSTISYQYINDIILQNERINNENIQITSFINGGISNHYGLELGINYSPLKWLKSNFNINYNYSGIKSVEIVFPSNYSSDYQFTLKNSVKINKNIDGNISWRYRGASVDFYGEREQTQKVDIGLKIKIFSNKGSVSLRLTDVFDSYLYKGSEIGEDFRRNYSTKNASRVFHISLSYNIDKGDIEKRNKKKRDY